MLASCCLHQVTLKPANKHKIGILLALVFLQINEEEFGRFYVTMAKNGENQANVFKEINYSRFIL
jgi:hypothetical protein